MIKFKELRFNEMIQGDRYNFRNNEELKEISRDVIKFLKIKACNVYVSDLSIHAYTKKYSYQIVERAKNKFIVVKEDNYNNRDYSYIGIVE